MFGYIKPYRPELRFREMDDYKAIYCGLCKEQGKRFGLLSRLTLSYDFAFLALFLISLEEKPCASFKDCACLAHPFQKQCCCVESEAVAFSAKAATVLTYYKLRDDLSDHGFWHKLRAALFFPFAKSARKKALSDADAMALDEAAMKMMEAQSAAEKSGASPDKAAEPTAEFLSAALALRSEDPTKKRILSRFGYLVGRYVYLCDALDDLEDDRKKGNFNPFLSYGDAAVTEAKNSLFLTTAELENDLSLLEFYTYKELIENIVGLGLRAEVVRIIKKKGGDLDGAESL